MPGAQAYTLGELATRLGLRLEPGTSPPAEAAARLVHGLASLQSAGPGHLSFLTSQAYRKFLPATGAGAVLLREQDLVTCPVPALVSTNPYLSYAQASALFQTLPASPAGIHPSAIVSESAQVALTASVGPQAVIGEGVQVGERSVIGAGCVIGARSRIGEDCLLHPRVTLYHDVVLGNAVVVHSGAVLGADGFGFAKSETGWCKIHQLGRVMVGDRVEIGANTCIDRGALEDTVIEEGVIIDNLVQVAHNVRIGKRTAIAACTGIAGSAVIGADCTIAGAVGIVGHITIADGVHITAKSLVTGSIPESGSYSSGTALQKTGDWRRNAVRFLQLDRLFDRVRALEMRKPGD